MDIILIPGFWLDASSWQRVTPILEEAGHRVNALTLPGLEAADADRSGIGLRDHIDAVVEDVDAYPTDAQIVVVGHSGGGLEPGKGERVHTVAGLFEDGRHPLP